MSEQTTATLTSKEIRQRNNGSKLGTTLCCPQNKVSYQSYHLNRNHKMNVGILSFEINLTVCGDHRYKLIQELQDLWVKEINSFLFDMIVLSITAEVVD